MRGFFAIGVERISKGFNVGNILRTAHAFGASFMFTIGAIPSIREMNVSDTSHASAHVPLYHYPDMGNVNLPRGCAVVGVELLDEAIDLPSFHHPLQAAYILGPEMGSLSPAVLERCDHTIKIPTKFCLNVGIAAALVMYDRYKTFGPPKKRS